MDMYTEWVKFGKGGECRPRFDYVCRFRLQTEVSIESNEILRGS
jgi:hypothetical protein